MAGIMDSTSAVPANIFAQLIRPAQGGILAKSKAERRFHKWLFKGRHSACLGAMPRLAVFYHNSTINKHTDYCPRGKRAT